MTVFYRVTLNGQNQGKDNRNILHYRAAIDPFAGALGMGGAEDLAELVATEVVPSFMALHPASYMLESIDVSVHGEAFQLLYQLPYRKSMGITGTNGDGQTDGPATCGILRFNLESVAIGAQALTAPKHGYLAVGPIPSSWIGDDGKLVPALLSDLAGNMRKFANDVSKDLGQLLPPVDFFPIRISQKWGAGSTAGSLISWGYADVRGATWSTYASYRRSRRARS